MSAEIYRINDNFKDIFEHIMVLNKGIILGQNTYKNVPTFDFL